MNAENRQREIDKRHSAEPPDRYRAEPKQPLGGGPLASSKVKAASARDRTERRAEQREMAKQRRPAEARRRAKARRLAKTARRYWITPKAKRRYCSHCSATSSTAIRPSDQNAACAECIDRLGIEAWESEGSIGVAGVTTRRVDPGEPFITRKG